MINFREMASFHDLPNEIVRKIFDYGDYKSRAKLQTVCKRFRSILTDDVVPWSVSRSAEVVIKATSWDYLSEPMRIFVHRFDFVDEEESITDQNKSCVEMFIRGAGVNQTAGGMIERDVQEILRNLNLYFLNMTLYE